MSDFTAQRENTETIIQSLAVGYIDKTGVDARSDGSVSFNDASDENIGNWPYIFNINKFHPMEKINVQFRTKYIDGLTVTYRLLDDGNGLSGSSKAIQHGSQFTATESSANTVTFDENEILLSVTGRAGTNDSNKRGIFEITFLKFDSATGKLTMQTYGKDDSADVFYASGPIFAFAGNQNNKAKQLGLETLAFISSNIRLGTDNIQSFWGEQVLVFNSYSAASAASCKFVDAGKSKVQPSDLVLFKSRLKASPAYDKVVGVGIKLPSGTTISLLRLDTDDSGKGIHFNAVCLSDSSRKLAACLKGTNALSPEARNDLYMQYIKALENRSAQFIWNWWLTGTPKAGPEEFNFPNIVPANANIASGIIVSFLNVNTTDGHSGTGWAAGIGAGLDVTGGTLAYGSWDTLKSQQNVISVVAELDLLTIAFFVDDSLVAGFVGGGIGEVTFEGVGVFNWS